MVQFPTPTEKKAQSEVTTKRTNCANRLAEALEKGLKSDPEEVIPIKSLAEIAKEIEVWKFIVPTLIFLDCFIYVFERAFKGLYAAVPKYYI